MKRIIQAAALSLVMLSGSVCAVAQKRAVPGFFVLQEFATLKPYNQLSQDEKRDLLRTALFSKEINARGEAIKRLEGNFSNEQVKQIRDFDGGGKLIRATSLYNQNTQAMIGNIKNAKEGDKFNLAVIASFSGQPNTREEARNKLEQLRGGKKIDWAAEALAEQNIVVDSYLNSKQEAKAPVVILEEIEEDIEERGLPTKQEAGSSNEDEEGEGSEAGSSVSAQAAAAEQQRLEAEAAAAEQKAREEQERLAAEQKRQQEEAAAAEQERLAAEQQRLAAELKAQEEQAAAAAAQKLREEAAAAEQERLAAEQKAREEAAAAEQERLAAERKAQEEAAQAASSSQQQAALISEFSTFTIPGNLNKKSSDGWDVIDNGMTINLENLNAFAEESMQRLGSWQNPNFFGVPTFVPATAEELGRLNALANDITTALKDRSSDDVNALHQEIQKLINWGSATNLSDHFYRTEAGYFGAGKGQKSDDKPFGLTNKEIAHFTLGYEGSSIAPRDAFNFIAPKILEQVLQKYIELLNK